jgi:serine/threonine-protein kinase
MSPKKPAEQQTTMVGDGSASQVPTMPPDDDDEDGAVPPGYTFVKVLGAGGMGEVVLARDTSIGREVALKRMRAVAAARPDAETRFIREAKIQARLEHPAIVPVHTFGRDDDGKPYFTMKRLAGVTLDRKLDALPLQQLLAAFVDVCLAIELAHGHGVIHRDIKPANIMLGDFGEVYVLDWGVARVTDEAEPQSIDIVSAQGETLVGKVMGTPGYMAPEQALGFGMSPAIDVYALGCVLFEILAHEPLATRNPVSPSTRRPELAIPPELDEACMSALAEDPDKRPTARALGERVQRYLDGDRDVERRRRLAVEALAEARTSTSRADAIRAAGRALALDPESAEAGQLASSLILSPPDAVPGELQDSLDHADRAASRVRSKTSMIGFAAVLPFAAIVPFVEVKSWPLFIGFFAAVAGMVLISWLSYRRGGQIVWVSLVSTLLTTILLSRIASPFVLTPVVVCAIAVALTASPWLLERSWVVVGWVLAAVLLPFVLEELGVFERTWSFDGDHLKIGSSVIHGINRTAEAFVLVAANVVFIAAAGLFARATNRDHRRAARRLHVQAWHLRQLLP